MTRRPHRPKVGICTLPYLGCYPTTASDAGHSKLGVVHTIQCLHIITDCILSVVDQARDRSARFHAGQHAESVLRFDTRSWCKLRECVREFLTELSTGEMFRSAGG